MKTWRQLAIAVALGMLGACTSTTTSTMTGTGTEGQPTTAPAAQVDCSAVRCAECPAGQTPALRPPDCCRCVDIKGNQDADCAAVRCAACPAGQHLEPKPGNCCRCVPDPPLPALLDGLGG